MRSLIVEARSLESAQNLSEALAEFHPRLTGSEQEGFRVAVELGTVDRLVISVLDALETYVFEKHAGPTRVELDGRRYTLR